MQGAGLSKLAEELRGSAILNIADEVRALAAQGGPLLNLTVGDFNPKQFRIPRELEDDVVAALRAGETNYPPPQGLESMRRAVCDFYGRRLGWKLTPERVLITAGARPAIYGMYRALVDAGETVVYGVPGWNNEYYCDMVGARAVRLACDARTNFLPTAAQVRPHLREARLLALNSPLNPTGTSLSAEQLAGLCDAVLEENARRGPNGRALYLFYDQVYWMITTAGTEHVHPVGLRPAIEPYTVGIDAISKAFAATGLRVGWAVAMPPVIRAMNNIIGHVGAWAPRPEQVASARLLENHAAVDTYIAGMRREAAARLDAVYRGLAALKGEGLPVEALRPQGAIYASARFALHGMSTPEGERLTSDDDVRRYLLNAAGLAVVPFGAFGAEPGQGWMRLAIGVVSVAEIEALMPRLREAMGALRPAEQPVAR